MAQRRHIVGGIVLVVLTLFLYWVLTLSHVPTYVSQDFLILFVVIGVGLIIWGAVSRPSAPSRLPGTVLVPRGTSLGSDAPAVIVNVAPTAPQPGPVQVLRRCAFCQTAYPEAEGKCPKCGAPF